MSPPPSSSAVIENEMRPEVPGKRPLQLDKSGMPTGQMETILHTDIVSFVKDLNPVVGWEGQTREGRQRLHDRVNHYYLFYGDSSKLSEKYLKKRARATLIQFR